MSDDVLVSHSGMIDHVRSEHGEKVCDHFIRILREHEGDEDYSELAALSEALGAGLPVPHWDHTDCDCGDF
jgi:hypothetical protein